MKHSPSGPAKPTPVPDDLSRPYWDSANRGVLAVQQCQGCQTFHHPPVSLCTTCTSTNLKHERMSGRGRISTYTITHDARTPAFLALQPYAVVWVELDEQPGLMLVTNMPDTPIDDVRIGDPVEVWFEEIVEGTRIPQFRRTRAPNTDAREGDT